MKIAIVDVKTGKVKHVKHAFADILIKTKKFAYHTGKEVKVIEAPKKDKKDISEQSYEKKVIEEAPIQKIQEPVIIPKETIKEEPSKESKRGRKKKDKDE